MIVAVSAACCDTEDPKPEPEACLGTDGDRFRFITNSPGGAFMSVWGRSSDDVYAVGGDPGLGGGPAAFHLRDRFWQTMSTAGTAGALNWVFGPGDDPDGPVWMVGQNATVLRHDPADGQTAREEVPSPASTMFWGTWGTGEDDMWAVGGGDGRFQLLHRTGGAWTDAGDELPAGLREDAVLYKIWGDDAGDLWVVGSQSTVLRRTAGAWSQVPLPDGLGDQASLLTVHDGGDGRPLIVGGPNPALMLRWTGSALESLPLPEGSPPNLNGVRVGPSVLGDVVAVGGLGALIHGRAGDALTLASETSHGLHAVWVDEKCEVWAAGGDLTSENVGGDGVLLHYGEIVPKSMHRGL